MRRIRILLFGSWGLCPKSKADVRAMAEADLGANLRVSVDTKAVDLAANAAAHLAIKQSAYVGADVSADLAVKVAD